MLPDPFGSLLPEGRSLLQPRFCLNGTGALQEGKALGMLHNWVAVGEFDSSCHNLQINKK